MKGLLILTRNPVWRCDLWTNDRTLFQAGLRVWQDTSVSVKISWHKYFDANLEHKTSWIWSTKKEPGIHSWWYPPLYPNWMHLGALVAIDLSFCLAHLANRGSSNTQRNISRSSERVRSRRCPGKKSKNTSSTNLLQPWTQSFLACRWIWQT